MTRVSAGRVGRVHAWDGSFYVDGPDHDLPQDTPVTVAGREHVVERRAGTDQKPLVRLSGVGDRDEAIALFGEPILVEAELEEGEWLAAELVGLRVAGLGLVERVLAGPSCDVLELDDGTLVPLVSDAVEGVDIEAGVVRVNLEFLGKAP